MDSEDIKRFKELYERKEHYGRNSIKLYDYIEDIIKKNNYKVILDYGCGNSILYQKLEENLKVKVYRYDPAIKGLEKIPPKNYDFVICSDVNSFLLILSTSSCTVSSVIFINYLQKFIII